MRKVLFFVFLLSGELFAQTKVTVTVANFSFTPANITINVGDTVEFINTSGTHWVDGRQSVFASNPASFDNQTQSGTGWTYKQVFNTAGLYNYRCGIHTSTMTGTIDVQVPAGVSELEDDNGLNFYPNPAKNSIFLSNYKEATLLQIYNTLGEEVMSIIPTQNSIDISSLTSGTYFVKISNQDKSVTTKLVVE